MLELTTQRSWVPVCRRSSVSTNKPFKVDFLNNTISVTSDGSNYFAFNNICPHRRAFLSDGRVENGCVVCPYHGIGFDASNGNVAIVFPDFNHEKLGMKLKTYKVKVFYELVWINMDSNEDLEFGPVNLNSTEDGIKLSDFVDIHGTMGINMGIFDIQENLLDSTHLTEVHSFSNRVDPMPRNVRKFPEGRGNYFDYKVGAQSIAKVLGGNSKTLSVFNAFAEPFSAMSRVRFGEKRDMIKAVRVHLLPINNKKTRMFWTLSRNFLTFRFLDSFFKHFIEVTIEEDKKILKTIADNSSSHRNMLTEFNWIIVQYRKRMNELLG